MEVSEEHCFYSCFRFLLFFPRFCLPNHARVILCGTKEKKSGQKKSVMTSRKMWKTRRILMCTLR